MHPTEKISLSLTGAGLEYNALADLQRFFIEEGGEYNTVPHTITHATRKNSHVRKLRELNLRLKSLTGTQKSLLVEGDTTSRKLIAFLSVLKSYRIVSRFIEEEVFTAFRQLPHTISYSDFDSFIFRLEQEFPDLSGKSEATFKKIRSRVFGMMVEIGMLDSSSSKTLQRPFMPQTVKNVITEDADSHINWFLHEK